MKKCRAVFALLLAVIALLCSCEAKTDKETDKETNKEIENIAVGSYIKFGAYEQDNDMSNGKEEIEWLVLAKEGNKALIISKYVLDRQQYHMKGSEVTWETCSMRTWLNNTFLNEAFNSEEQAKIATVMSEDKVFLLSISEAYQYFSSDTERQCYFTDYVWERYDYASFYHYDTACWWLRSTGENNLCAANVDVDGKIREDGTGVNYRSFCARPALWIDLAA